MPQQHNYGSNIYEMMTYVRRKLSEATASFWTDLEIYKELNTAQLHIATKARCLKRSATITTTASTQEYDLNSSTNGFPDIIDIAEDGVSFKVGGTSWVPLTYKTKKQLNMEFPGWQGVAAGTPQYYYYYKATKTIGLHPKPNSSNAGAYLAIEGYHKPKILNAGTASAGALTSITLPAGSSTVPYPNPTDDYYNNLYIEIYANTGAGQKVKITDHVGSTRVCSATFTTAPDSTSTYGMVPQIQEEAHYLMPLYALWKLWPKGGSRVSLGNNYRQEFIAGLSEFIGEDLSDDDQEIVKETYR